MDSILSNNNKIKPGDFVKLFSPSTNPYTSVRLYKYLAEAKAYNVPQLGRPQLGSKLAQPDSVVVLNPSSMLVLEIETEEKELIWGFKLLAEGNKIGWISMLNPDYYPRHLNTSLYGYGIKKV